MVSLSSRRGLPDCRIPQAPSAVPIIIAIVSNLSIYLSRPTGQNSCSSEYLASVLLSPHHACFRRRSEQGAGCALIVRIGIED
jgi:hypothetical protein